MLPCEELGGMGPSRYGSPPMGSIGPEVGGGGCEGP